MSITHKKLIEDLINGKKINQIPVAFWRHFPMDDQDPTRLAAATINFQDTFEMDIIKVSPSSSFCLKDWGIKDRWNGNIEGTRDYIKSSQKSLSGVRNLEILTPRSGFLKNQIDTLVILSKYYSPNTPIIQTIFSPLAQLKNLLGKDQLIHSIRHNPELVKDGLEIITESTNNFINACFDLNIDGIFYAVQHASSLFLSRTEFIEFGKNFDKRLFPSIKKFWIRLLHIHGNDIYFDLCLDYPFNIINWHDREIYPNLEAASKITDKILCGGLNRISTMVQGDKETISSEIDDAFSQMNGKSFILGTGCVLPIISPYGNIKLAIDYARSL
jgi:uroporphyrinogen decarboxylase